MDMGCVLSFGAMPSNLMDLRVMIIDWPGSHRPWVYHGQPKETSRQLQQNKKMNQAWYRMSELLLHWFMDYVIIYVWISISMTLILFLYVSIWIDWHIYVYVVITPWVCGSPLAIFFQVISSLFDRSLVTSLYTEVRLKTTSPSSSARSTYFA